MKILWVSSAAIGPASRILELPYGGSSGTWIQSEFERLKEYDNIQMSFLCPIIPEGGQKYITKQTEEGVAYGICYSPFITYGKELPGTVNTLIEDIIKKINPDIIHIWGTESSFSAGVATLANEYKKVIFIQGLIGIHQRYTSPHYVRENKYWGWVSPIAKLKNTIKRYYFRKQIPLEQKAISATGNIITDNALTKAYCLSFCPQTQFFQHFLAPNFAYYESKWDYDKCEKNSVFTIFTLDKSKGLAQLLKAIKIAKQTIPDIKLVVPGPFNLDSNNTINLQNCTSFEKWVYNYIKENKLAKNIEFCGRLNVEEMIAHYRRANCFISPSCMEVHSTSVREAMAIGTPTIASMCGSMIELIKHRENGYIYRFEEEEMLAYYMLQILETPSLAEKIGTSARDSMKKLIDDENNSSILEIYNSILGIR